jgi:nucleotide sugar dehydrogenase
MFNVSIIGLGFVGSAIYDSFSIKLKNVSNINLTVYDKYKNGGIGSLEKCLNTNIMFLCLPTLFDSVISEYDKSNIYEICDKLEINKYNGIVVIKSTVEPETTNNLSTTYKSLKFVHNPEFLTARTAFEDFHNQAHIVLGKSENSSNEDLDLLGDFYGKLYPNSEISRCNCLESEAMKIFCNTFYSVKIQFFTELFLLCKSNNSNYDVIRELMIKNGWINPMHTTIPGPDGSISYGGLCFPKDTNALIKYMEKKNVPCSVLKNTILERNTMRTDYDNCK